MANLQSQIDILAKAVVKEHISFEDYKVNNKGSVTLSRVSYEVDVYNSVGVPSKLGIISDNDNDNGKKTTNYIEENHKLVVKEGENEVSTTMFTYSDKADFGGFLFYDDNDNKYSINEIGQIISNSSIKFGLQWNSFIRRINLNEGEIGKTQSNKNRMIYVNEETLVGDKGISFDEDTLLIDRNSDGVNWVGKYYIEIFDVSNNKKIQLIVDLELESIVYPLDSGYSVKKREDLISTGKNFDIKDDNDNIIYIYRSVDINANEFVNYDSDNNIIKNTTLLAIHLTPEVKNIGDNAFNSCINLTQITIDNEIETISESAFTNCDKIETIIVTGTNGVNPVTDLIKERLIEKIKKQ